MENQNQTKLNNNEGASELDVCKKQAEEYLNNWKRERADFINYKKDEVKRLAEFVKFANEDLILGFIEILDDLYLAAKQVKNEGLDQTIKKLEDWLKKYEVERIGVEGKNFDPLLHEAIASRMIDGQDETSNVKEVRAGWKMHGKIIRPARVSIEKLST